ncbi:MAG: helix-turn-helix transcriptional regulator [Desulfobacterales bacterium]|nr:helix-turn-helix transcriptional regulator [Desulfobacterales bacterium]
MQIGTDVTNIHQKRGSAAKKNTRKPPHVRRGYATIYRVRRHSQFGGKMVVEAEIGKRIKALRLGKKLTLQVMADRTGLSKGYLSKLEKSEKAPPVSTLINIAKAFGVTISVLLGEVNEEDSVLLVKKTERVLLAGPGTEFGYSYESLAHAFQGRLMEPYILTFPSKSVPRHQFKHEGQEMLFVVQGTMRFFFAEKVFIVEKGDCIYFDSGISHYGESMGEEELVALMVISNSEEHQNSRA